MILYSVMFYIFSFAIVFGAMRVIFSRNPVHSVLFLVLVFFNAAGLFILMGAEFLAMMLVIVYVGAVAVLFLFIVMMLDINTISARRKASQHLFLGVTLGTILLAELIVTTIGWTLVPNFNTKLQEVNAITLTNTQALGQVLYTKYFYLFQLSGVILLVAMVGSILLTLRSQSSVRKQFITSQLERTKANSLKIQKVPTRGGV